MSDDIGLVVARYGAEVLIRAESGEIRRAVARRKLDSIVCGDRVRWRAEASGNAAVLSITARRNLLERTYFRGKSRSIAANIDSIIIVIAAEPTPDWSLVDGLLLTARRIGADVLLVRNKCDLDLSPDLNAMLQVYRGIGYAWLETTSRNPATLVPLTAALTRKTSVLIGQSGTGKSTLINHLVPDAEARTGDVSETTGFGQHTTSMARLYALPGGGALIDSPGIRDFTPSLPSVAEIRFGFIEFGRFAENCKFSNCLHRNEPNCGVLAAVNSGAVSAARHASYLSLLTTAES